MYRYALTERPPSIGTQPRGTKNIVSFENKQYFKGIMCYGYVEYDTALTEEQIKEYELREV